jgi:hypothetical protein
MRIRHGSSLRLPLAVLVLGLGSLVAVPSFGDSAVERGRALFVGREALRGKLRHHAEGLPAEVIACGNCHGAQRGEGPKASRAPRLDRALLLEPRERRGGPPSAYSAASFCKLLRTGIDPAHVMIAREMPVYTVDDAQCRSLWQFLTDGAAPRATRARPR